MSMPASPGTPTPPQGTAGSTDIVSTLQGIVRNLSAIRQSMNSIAKLLAGNNAWTGNNTFPNVGLNAIPYASLPASPTVGMIACVNNSSVNTWGGTADGAGGFTVLVWYNSGDIWTVIGQ